MEKLVKCTTISVDCVHNDPVDIRCGGPEYLGFDFSVEQAKKEEMKNFIAESLTTLEVPVVGISCYGEKELPEASVWTKERILASIKEDAKYLKSEAKMGYYKVKY